MLVLVLVLVLVLMLVLVLVLILILILILNRSKMRLPRPPVRRSSMTQRTYPAPLGGHLEAQARAQTQLWPG